MPVETINTSDAPEAKNEWEEKMKEVPEFDLDDRLKAIMDEAKDLENQAKAQEEQGNIEEAARLREQARRTEQYVRVSAKNNNSLSDLDAPTGEESTGDEFGDFPSGEEPSGDEPTGEEPIGDFPTGEQLRSALKGRFFVAICNYVVQW